MVLLDLLEGLLDLLGLLVPLFSTGQFLFRTGSLFGVWPFRDLFSFFFTYGSHGVSDSFILVQAVIVVYSW